MEATSPSSVINPRVTWLAAAWLAVCCAISGLSGCASAEKHPGDPSVPPVSEASPSPLPQASPSPLPSGAPAGIMETYGPPPPEAMAPSYGPVPVTLRPVVLVLGPGKARGFAYVGAIRSLVAAKVPVGAVLGTEMGALVGSLYAVGGKINQFEWALLKFKEDVFVSGRSLMPSLFQKSGKTKRIESELERVFGGKDLSQSAIPLRVAALLRDSNTPVTLSSGRAAAAVRAAMADLDLFEPAPWNGSQAVSAAQVRPFLVAEARALNLGPVVVIDALDEAEEKRVASAGELKDADLVIRPDLSGIGPMEFDKRTDAAFRGKKAVDGRLAEIRQLVGMPAEGASP